MPENKIIESTVNGKYQMYQGKPLVREGARIVYGDMADPYMLIMMIISNKTIVIGNKSEDVPDNIMVQITKTDTTIPYTERIVEMIQCKGLTDALRKGIIRMDRLNKR